MTETYLPSYGQTYPTEPDNKPTSNQPNKQIQPAAPTSLKVLLAFVVIQILFAIGVLVVKIVFNYIGFTGATPLVIDQASCTGYYYLLSKYEGSQKYIMMISLVGVAVCILFSFIILIIVSKAVHQSKKLPSNTYTVISPTLTISTLYQIIGPKTRALLYILQSISLLGVIAVLGYYLPFFINMKRYGCSWSAADTSTKILVICAIAAALFVVAWIVWIIIVVINIKNRSDEVYQQEEKEKPKKEYNNVNTTEMNTQYYDNTRKQFVPPPEEKKNDYRYYNPQKQEKEEPVQKVRTLDSQKEQYVINSPDKGRRYYYNSPKNEEKKDTYENPVFGEKRQLYGSPYERIQRGRYYEGDRDRQRDEIRPQMMPVEQKEKQKQLYRPRFSPNNKKYDTYNAYEKQSPVKESEQYLGTLSRYRLELQDKDKYQSNQSRQYLPESSNSSAKYFQGSGKPKLHSNYFKDEVIPKKRERKGILNDYIRGKYADN